MSWFFRSPKPASAKTPSNSDPQHDEEGPLRRKNIVPTNAFARELGSLKAEFLQLELLEGEAAKRGRIVSIITRFLKLFEHTADKDIPALFKHEPLQSFSMHVARFTVKEIRTRAAKHSTAEASRQVVLFFADGQEGHALLQALLRLVSIGNVTVEPMVSMSLPSTLSKLLYLLLDLPSETATSPATRAFHTTISPLMKALFSYQRSTSELLRTSNGNKLPSDISRLFDLIHTPTQASNVCWREMAQQLLIQLYTASPVPALISHTRKHTLLPSTVSSIISNADISLLEKAQAVQCLCRCVYGSDQSNAVALVSTITAARTPHELATFILSNQSRWEQLATEEAEAHTAARVSEAPVPPPRMNRHATSTKEDSRLPTSTESASETAQLVTATTSSTPKAGPAQAPGNPFTSTTPSSSSTNPFEQALQQQKQQKQPGNPFEPEKRPSTAAPTALSAQTTSTSLPGHIDIATAPVTLSSMRRHAPGQQQLSNQKPEAPLSSAVSSTVREALQMLIRSFNVLLLVGERPLAFKKVKDPLQTFAFAYPSPSGARKSIKSEEVVQQFVLQLTRDIATPLLRHIFIKELHVIIARDKVNYFILREYQVLSQVLDKIDAFQQDAVEAALDLLYYVASTLGYVPREELHILMSKVCTAQPAIARSVLSSFYALLTTAASYSDVFRELGLFETLISRIDFAARQSGGTEAPEETMPTVDAAPTSDSNHGDDNNGEDCLVLDEQSVQSALSDLIVVLLENPKNVIAFKNAGGTNAIKQLAAHPKYRARALRMLRQLVLVDPSHSGDDIGALLEMMQAASPYSGLKIDVLDTFIDLFASSSKTRALFRKAHGFVYVVHCLVSLAQPMAQAVGEQLEGSVRDKYQMRFLRAILHTIASALRGNLHNQQVFEADVRYAVLKESILVSGLASGDNAKHVFRLILLFLGDRFENEGSTKVKFSVAYPGVAAEVLAPLLASCSETAVLDYVLTQLLFICERRANGTKLANSGLLGRILSSFSTCLRTKSDPVHEKMLQLVVKLGSIHITGSDLRAFLHLFVKSGIKGAVTTSDAAPVGSEGLGEDEEHCNGTTTTSARTDGHAIMPSFALEALLQMCLLSGEEERVGSPISRMRMTPADHCGINAVELSLGDGRRHSSVFIPNVASISKAQPFVPSAEEFGSVGLKCAQIVNSKHVSRAWPPTAGFSLSMWVCIDDWGITQAPLPLFHAFLPTEPPTSLFAVESDPLLSCVCVMSGLEKFVFQESTISPGWHHLTLLMKGKSKLKHASCEVFIDGVQTESKKVLYPTAGSHQAVNSDVQSQVCVSIGTAKHPHNIASSQLWRFSGLMFSEEILTTEVIRTFYQLGPSYAGLLQGDLASYQGWPFYGTCCAMDDDPSLAALLASVPVTVDPFHAASPAPQQTRPKAPNPFQSDSGGARKGKNKTGRAHAPGNRQVRAASRTMAAPMTPGTSAVDTSAPFTPMVLEGVRLASIDYSVLPTPLLQYEKVWLHINGGNAFGVGVQQCLKVMGGTIAGAVFHAFAGVSSSNATLLSVANGASTPPYAHLVGAASAFKGKPLAKAVLEVGGLPVLIEVIAACACEASLLAAVGLLVRTIKAENRIAQELLEIDMSNLLAAVLMKKGEHLSLDAIDSLLTLCIAQPSPVAATTFLVSPFLFSHIFSFQNFWCLAPAHVRTHLIRRCLHLLDPRNRFCRKNAALLHETGTVSVCISVIDEGANGSVEVASAAATLLTSILLYDATFQDVHSLIQVALSTLVRDDEYEGRDGNSSSDHRDSVPVENLDQSHPGDSGNVPAPSYLQQTRHFLLDALTYLAGNSRTRRLVGDCFLRHQRVSFLLAFFDTFADERTVCLALRLLSALYSQETAQNPFQEAFAPYIPHLARLFTFHASSAELIHLLFALVAGKPLDAIPQINALSASALLELLAPLKSDDAFALPEFLPCIFECLHALLNKYYEAFSPKSLHDSIKDPVDNTLVQFPSVIVQVLLAFQHAAPTSFAAYFADSSLFVAKGGMPRLAAINYVAESLMHPLQRASKANASRPRNTSSANAQSTSSAITADMGPASPAPSTSDGGDNVSISSSSSSSSTSTTLSPFLQSLVHLFFQYTQTDPGSVVSSSQVVCFCRLEHHHPAQLSLLRLLVNTLTTLIKMSAPGTGSSSVSAALSSSSSQSRAKFMPFIRQVFAVCPPVALRASRAVFAFEIFQAYLRSVLEDDVFSSAAQAPASVALQAIARLTAVFASQLLRFPNIENNICTLQLLFDVVSQLVDDSGAVFSFAEAVHGKQTVEELLSTCLTAISMLFVQILQTFTGGVCDESDSTTDNARRENSSASAPSPSQDILTSGLSTLLHHSRKLFSSSFVDATTNQALVFLILKLMRHPDEGIQELAANVVLMITRMRAQVISKLLDDLQIAPNFDIRSSSNSDIMGFFASSRAELLQALEPSWTAVSCATQLPTSKAKGSFLTRLRLAATSSSTSSPKPFRAAPLPVAASIATPLPPHIIGSLNPPAERCSVAARKKSTNIDGENERNGNGDDGGDGDDDVGTYCSEKRDAPDHGLRVGILQCTPLWDDITDEALKYIIRRSDVHERAVEAAKMQTALYWELLFSLHRERGLFGPDTTSYLDRWELDMNEGAHRMRRRMASNPDFYARFPQIGVASSCPSVATATQQPTAAAGKGSKRHAESFDAGHFYTRYVIPTLRNPPEKGDRTLEQGAAKHPPVVISEEDVATYKDLTLRDQAKSGIISPSALALLDRCSWAHALDAYAEELLSFRLCDVLIVHAVKHGRDGDGEPSGSTLNQSDGDSSMAQTTSSDADLLEEDQSSMLERSSELLSDDADTVNADGENKGEGVGEDKGDGVGDGIGDGSNTAGPHRSRSASILRRLKSTKKILSGIASSSVLSSHLPQNQNQDDQQQQQQQQQQEQHQQHQQQKPSHAQALPFQPRGSFSATDSSSFRSSLLTTLTAAASMSSSSNPAATSASIVASVLGEEWLQRPERVYSRRESVQSLSSSVKPGYGTASLPPRVPDAAEPSSLLLHPVIAHTLKVDDEFLHVFDCRRVNGLESYEAVLFVCRQTLYLIHGFRLSEDGLSLEPELALNDMGLPRTSDFAHQTVSWSCSDIRDIRKGRYLLQDKALELFSSVGQNLLMSFKTSTLRDHVYATICSLAPVLAESAEDSVAGMHRDAKIEQGGFFSVFSGAKTVTSRWENGELSNFQYLMYLNTLAGRSYSDLNQYPVFPWVVKVFSDETLDTASADTFRDLSKPMGAQTPSRAEGFKLRYEAWDESISDGVPPFHYGTHYSSAAGVSGFLIRLEPFSHLFVTLQGGHFDHPDRLFDSIEEAWESASEKNNGDVKELTPEFFYLPYFLFNQNNLDLGRKQNGTYLDDVALPAWAKGDPYEFIRAHREALESDIVSSQLHLWIDLIFGHKQQGSEAVKALNVFHHLTYEGAVDIDTIEDEVDRVSTIGFINNFGQTPRRLFKKPHPSQRARFSAGKHGKALSALTNWARVVPCPHPLRMLCAPIGDMAVLADGRVLVVPEKSQIQPPAFTRGVNYAHFRGGLVSFALQDDATSFGAGDPRRSVYENLHAEDITALSCPGNDIVITGSSDASIRLWDARGRDATLQLRDTLYGHTAAVVALAVSLPFHLLVSGSEDESCIVWDLAQGKYLRQLRGDAESGPVGCIALSPDASTVLMCQKGTLHVWDINGVYLARNPLSAGLGSRITSCLYNSISDWSPHNTFITGHEDGKIRVWVLSREQSLRYNPVHVPCDARNETGLQHTESQLPWIGDGVPMFALKLGTSRPITLRHLMAEVLRKAESTDNDSDGGDTVDSLADEDAGSHLLRDASCAEHVREFFASMATPTGVGEEIASEDVQQADGEKEGEEPGHMHGNGTGEREADTAHDSQMSSEVDVVVVCDEDSAPEGADGVSARQSDVPLASSAKEGHSPSGCNVAQEAVWVRILRQIGTLCVPRAHLNAPPQHGSALQQREVAVTCLLVDNKAGILYSGDSEGQVFTWSAPSLPEDAQAAPNTHWVKDNSVSVCMNTMCQTKFTSFERRHHCRSCGGVYCNKCTSREVPLPQLNFLKPVRVCDRCYAKVRQQQSQEAHLASQK